MSLLVGGDSEAYSKIVQPTTPPKTPLKTVGLLQVYEHPIQNEEVYKYKININSESDLMKVVDKKMYLLVTDIQKSKNFSRDSTKCPNQFITNGNNNTNLQSCDPLKFTYDLLTIPINNNKYDYSSIKPTDSSKLLEQLKLIYTTGEFIDLSAKLLALPELAYSVDKSEVNEYINITKPIPVDNYSTTLNDFNNMVYTQFTD